MRYFIRICFGLIFVSFGAFAQEQDNSSEASSRLVEGELERFDGWWGGYASNPIGIEIDSDGFWRSASFGGNVYVFENPIPPNEWGEFEQLYNGRVYHFIPIGNYYVANEWLENEHTGVAVLRSDAPSVPTARSGGQYLGPWGGAGGFLASIEVDDNGRLLSFQNGHDHNAIGGPLVPVNDFGTLQVRQGQHLWSFVPIEKFFVAYYFNDGELQGLAILEPSDVSAKLAVGEQPESMEIDRRLFSGQWAEDSGSLYGSEVVLQLLDDQYLIYCSDTFEDRVVHFRCELWPYFHEETNSIFIPTHTGKTSIAFLDGGLHAEFLGAREDGLELKAEMRHVPWCVPQFSNKVRWVHYHDGNKEILGTRSDGVVEFRSGVINIDKRPTFEGNYRVRMQSIGSVLTRLRQTPTDLVKVYVVPTSENSAQVGLWYGQEYRLTGKLRVTDEMLAQAWLLQLGYLEDRVGKTDIDGQFGSKSNLALAAFYEEKGMPIDTLSSFLDTVSRQNPEKSPWCGNER